MKVVNKPTLCHALYTLLHNVLYCVTKAEQLIINNQNYNLNFGP